MPILDVVLMFFMSFLNPNEVRDVKDILAELDPDAFISVLNIDEVVSSDFKIRRKNYDK